MTPGVAMADDLLTTARELWPGSELVDAHQAQDGRPVRARYAVVPRLRSPVALVPLDPPAAAAASLRRLSSASSWLDAAARLSAAAAARAMPGVLRDRLEVRGGEPGLAAYLAELLGGPVTFSISVGTARVNRKPVLQVFDERGGCLAFVKVGWSGSTCDDVRAEGRALTVLAGRTFSHIVPPSLVARGSWEGRPVLAAEPLRPPAWHRPNLRWIPPLAAMEELAATFAQPDCRLADSAWWQRQWQVAGSLEDVVLRGRLGRALDRVGAIAGHRDLAWSAWHGDWTPWNMARSGDRVLLWDWERFELGVPRGLDPLHYIVNDMTTQQGSASPDTVLSALAVAMHGELRSGSDEYLRCLLYLVAVVCRYLRLSETPGGGHIASRGDQMLLALEELVAA